MRAIAIALGLLLTATVATAPPAAASDPTAVPQGPVTLNTEVSVDDKLVRLGDLFSGIDPAKAEIAMAHAPEPGGRTVLDTVWLARMSLRHKLGWRPRTRFERAIVEREGLRITQDAIKDAVMATYRGEQPGAAQLRGEAGVYLDNTHMKIIVPKTATGAGDVHDFRFDPNSGRFSAEIAVDGDARVERRAIAGQIVSTQRVPVLNRRIGRGEVITQADIDYLKVREQQITERYITNPDLLIGMTPRRSLDAAKPVRENEIVPPTVVDKGSMVLMVYRTPLMQLTAQGRALNEGARGEVLRVINTRTNRTIHAKVRRSGQVEVLAANQLVLR